jgi:hypothetical protein
MDSSSSSSAAAAATWTAEDWRHLLERLVPAVRWLRTYDVRNYLKADLIAGITVGTMLVPQVKRDPTCENGIFCLLLSFLQTTLRSALTTTGREVEDLTMSAKGFNLQSVSQLEKVILWVLDRVSSRQCHMRGLQDFTPSMASVSSNSGHRLSALKICLLIKLCSCQ